VNRCVPSHGGPQLRKPPEEADSGRSSSVPGEGPNSGTERQRETGFSDSGMGVNSVMLAST